MLPLNILISICTDNIPFFPTSRYIITHNHHHCTHPKCNNINACSFLKHIYYYYYLSIFILQVIWCVTRATWMRDSSPLSSTSPMQNKYTGEPAKLENAARIYRWLDSMRDASNLLIQQELGNDEWDPQLEKMVQQRVEEVCKLPCNASMSLLCWIVT